MGSLGDRLRAALLAFGATTVIRLLTRPAVRSAIRGEARRLLTGTRERPAPLQPVAEATAAAIAPLLRQYSGTPIVVDGLPGSGKTTLARSLARRLGMTPRTLHARDVARPVRFGPGVVYENMRLLRTQNVDACCAILYLDVPPGVARERVITRDRNAALADFLDFQLLHRIGRLAYSLARGRELSPGRGRVRVKLRPAGGYQLDAAIDRHLARAGLPGASLNREAKLFLLATGRARQGLWPYLRLDAYQSDLVAGLGAALDELL